MDSQKIASHTLEAEESEFLRRLAASRNGKRLQLLDSMERLKAAEAEVDSLRQSVSVQDLQLGSAVSTIAVLRGEKDPQEWVLGPEGKAIVRSRQG